MKKLSILFFFIFLISFASSAKLSISPTQLDFNMVTNQKSCNQITIYTEKVDSLIGKDKWAEEGVIERKFSLHKFSSGDLDLKTSYTKIFESENSAVVDVCITAKNKGLYHGLLLYKTEGDNAGVGIWMTANVSKKERLSINKLTGKAITIGNISDERFLIIVPIILTIILIALWAIILLKLNKKKKIHEGLN